MDYFINGLINRYTLGVVSLSLVSTWVISDYKSITDWKHVIFTFVALMAFFHLLKICMQYIYKLYIGLISKIKEHINLKKKVSSRIANFDLLSVKQKKILWSLYNENKLALKIYDSDVKSLFSNEYIKKGQEDSANSNAIYTLNSEVRKHMHEVNSKKIIDALANLSNEESAILNMFFENKNEEIYEHPWIDKKMYEAISKLDSHGIIKHKSESEESLVLMPDTVSNIGFIKRLSLKRDLIILNSDKKDPQMI